MHAYICVCRACVCTRTHTHTCKHTQGARTGQGRPIHCAKGVPWPLPFGLKGNAMCCTLCGALQMEMELVQSLVGLKGRRPTPNTNNAAIGSTSADTDAHSHATTSMPAGQDHNRNTQRNNPSASTDDPMHTGNGCHRGDPMHTGNDGYSASSSSMATDVQHAQQQSNPSSLENSTSATAHPQVNQTLRRRVHCTLPPIVCGQPLFLTRIRRPTRPHPEPRDSSRSTRPVHSQDTVICILLPGLARAHTCIRHGLPCLNICTQLLLFAVCCLLFAVGTCTVPAAQHGRCSGVHARPPVHSQPAPLGVDP